MIIWIPLAPFSLIPPLKTIEFDCRHLTIFLEYRAYRKPIQAPEVNLRANFFRQIT